MCCSSRNHGNLNSQLIDTCSLKLGWIQFRCFSRYFKKRNGTVSKIHIFFHLLSSSSSWFHSFIFLSSFPSFLHLCGSLFFLTTRSMTFFLPSSSSSSSFSPSCRTFTPSPLQLPGNEIPAYWLISTCPQFDLFMFHKNTHFTVFLFLFSTGLSLYLKNPRSGKVSSPPAFHAESDKHSETLCSHVHSRPPV